MNPLKVKKRAANLSTSLLSGKWGISVLLVIEPCLATKAPGHEAAQRKSFVDLRVLVP